jgi:hypothetical protein
MASLEARFDKTPAIVLGSKNCGPCLRLVDQRDPPEMTDVCQLQKGVHVVSGARWCDEFEDFEEDFDREFVDGTTVWRGLWVFLLRRLQGILDEGPHQGTSKFIRLLPASVSV